MKNQIIEYSATTGYGQNDIILRRNRDRFKDRAKSESRVRNRN